MRGINAADLHRIEPHQIQGLIAGGTRQAIQHTVTELGTKRDGGLFAVPKCRGAGNDRK